MPGLQGMDSPPGRAAPHLVADFVELMCAASVDGEWGVSDLRTLRKSKDKDDATVLELSGRELLLGEDDPGEGTLDVAIAAALDMPLAEQGAGPDDRVQGDASLADDAPANSEPGPSADDDARSVEGSEIADVLSYRSTRFGSTWPFELYDGDNIRLREPLEPLHRIYLQLLIASCLSKLADKRDATEVTTAFERLAPGVLRGHLGPRTQAHLFGTSTRADDRYTGTLWEKVSKLATDLRVKLIADQAEVEAKAGDNGLDAVAWFATGDDAPTVMSVFAQCACGKGWRTKQHEASEARWVSVFAFRSPVVNMTLIPYSFRRPDGLWQCDTHVERGVLFDRERIVAALASDEAGGALDEPPALDAILRKGVG